VLHQLIVAFVLQRPAPSGKLTNTEKRDSPTPMDRDWVRGAQISPTPCVEMTGRPTSTGRKLGAAEARVEKMADTIAAAAIETRNATLESFMSTFGNKGPDTGIK